MGSPGRAASFVNALKVLCRPLHDTAALPNVCKLISFLIHNDHCDPSPLVDLVHRTFCPFVWISIGAKSSFNSSAPWAVSRRDNVRLSLLSPPSQTFNRAGGPSQGV